MTYKVNDKTDGRMANIGYVFSLGVALIAFGFSWIVKAGFLFMKDRNRKS